jgi:hypothetical protein
VLEAHRGVNGPEFLLDFLARHYLAQMLQKHHHNFKGLFLELDLQPVLTQFTAAQVHFEGPKVNQAWS